MVQRKGETTYEVYIYPVHSSIRPKAIVLEEAGTKRPIVAGIWGNEGQVTMDHDE